jgi:exodeoxyribonuclease VII large subunit
MNPQVISVSEFISIINETLGFAYPSVTVEGEVSGFKVSQNRWVFFDLKDESSVLNCFTTTRELKLPIEDGMKIRVTGNSKVLSKTSRFSLTARSIELAGAGELKRALELLRQKLDSEGLFDPARKRPLPKFPGRIGLITSGTSAAYADFIKILGSRWGGLDVVLADVAVQGSDAPDQIVGALEYFNHLSQPVDVIALIRGGGSLEDLMAFSTEPVARAVAASRTPVISGVGHEIDFSLADYAADVRAATPTDAARLIVPDRNEIRTHVDHLTARSESALRKSAQGMSARVEQFTLRLEHYLLVPGRRLEDLEQRLLRSFDRLGHRVTQIKDSTAAAERRLAAFEQLVLSDRRNRVAALERMLRSVDPKAVLNRGYAIVKSKNKILKNPNAVKIGDPLMIQLAEGNLDAKVNRHG